MYSGTCFRKKDATYVAYDYDEDVVEAVKTGRYIDVGCYPNEVQLVKPYLPELRQVFKFQREFAEHASRKLTLVERLYWSLRSIRSAQQSGQDAGQQLTFVGVHIRRADYSDHLSVLYNRTFVETSYFLKAMEIYRKEYQVSKERLKQ